MKIIISILALFSIYTEKLYADAFTLVVIPDTQGYTQDDSKNKNFEAKINWIIKNIERKNVVFISHVGDIISNNLSYKVSQICPQRFFPGLINKDKQQWERAKDSLKVLDHINQNIPYSIVPGNMDYDCKNNKVLAKAFKNYFRTSKYLNKEWILASGPSHINLAQEFQISNKPVIHIGLEWLPSDKAIAFAQKTITANPMKPVIITTHEYLNPGYPASRRGYGNTPNTDGNNNAEQVFNKLIDPFPQVFLVLSGHLEGNGFLKSKTSLNRDVIQIMADYSADPGGGNSWIKLISFDLDKKEIDFSNFSPTYKPGHSEGPNRAINSESNFKLRSNLNGIQEYLIKNEIRHYRQGQDNGFGIYKNAYDANIRRGNWFINLLDLLKYSSGNIHIQEKQKASHGLLRFKGFIGEGKGQIKPGTIIKKAILTLTTEGRGSEGDGARIQRLSLPWKKAINLGNTSLDSIIDNELTSNIDVETGFVNKGTKSFDVTKSVQSWLNGDSNYGWLFKARGRNDWQFRSSKWKAVVERPMLTIIYERE